MANVKWIVGGFALFALATLLGLGFSLVGPVHLIRVLGLVATIGGGAGMALHATALHRADSTRFGHWRNILATQFARAGGGPEGSPRALTTA